MSYFIIRRELHGQLSYSLQDAKPDYANPALDGKNRQKVELVFELTQRGECASLTLLKALAQTGTLMGSGNVKRVVNWPVATAEEPQLNYPGSANAQETLTNQIPARVAEAGAIAVTADHPFEVLNYMSLQCAKCGDIAAAHPS